jgi:HAD superfamily hydrolase (TIGR01509 family)
MIENLVIFDCDGVLVDSEVIACTVEAEELTRIGYPITVEEDIRLFAGKSQSSVMKAVERVIGEPLPENFEKGLEHKIINALARKLKPMPGAGKLLDMLPNKCVASNGSEEKIIKSLEAAGLMRYFSPEDIYSVNKVETGKPDPELFLYAASKKQFKPEKCIVIEDSVYGIQAGKIAGMQVYGYIGGSHIADPEKTTSLFEDAGADQVFGNHFELAANISELLAGC